jgi:hypothetical protein
MPAVWAGDASRRSAGDPASVRRRPRGAGRRRPLLVVLEDLHWADEASPASLCNLAGAAADARMLLVATSRLVLGSVTRGAPRDTVAACPGAGRERARIGSARRK